MKKLILLIFIPLLFTFQLYAHPAWGIAVDKDKNIYFADIGRNGMGTVWRFTAEGKLEALLKDFHAHSVSLDKKGNLYTAHGEGTHRLVKFSADRRRNETLINERDENRFFGGNSIVSVNGNIYFGIRKYIWKYEKGKEPIKFSPHKLEWNQAVFVDGEENIYAPDKETGNGTLFRLTADGKVEKVAANLISKLDRPRDRHNDVLLGIGKDKDGVIYIAESAGKRIIKISKTGQTETFYRSEDDFIPTGITFFENEAYILEFGTKRGNDGPRITKIDKTGKKKRLFDYGTYKEPVANSLNPDPHPPKWNTSLTLLFYGLFFLSLFVIGFWRGRKYGKK